MFIQPTLAGEDTYFDDDDDDDDEGNGDPSYVQNKFKKSPGSPDTFFFVQPQPSPSQPQGQMQSPAQAYAQSYVQTLNYSHDNDIRPQLATDSSQTPPSPIAKQRRSIQRPSLSNRNSLKRTSNIHTGYNSNQHESVDANLKDRGNGTNKTTAKDKHTRSLNGLPQKTLIHLLQIKEEERKRTKNLLRSALSQLEMEVEKGDLLGARVRELEERVESVRMEKGDFGVDALKEMLAEQKGRVNGGAELEGLKLKLSNTETELRRVKEDYRALKIERDDSDRALVRARAFAREMKEKAILIQAREQGRQEGFEEGLKQGRLLEEGGSAGEVSGSGRTRRRERSTNPKSSSRRNTNVATSDVGPSQASLEAEAAIRSIAERENERVRLQLKDVERDLDMERQKLREVEREKVRLERMAREERERRDEREREKEKVRDSERAKERAKEREREVSQAKEREKERDMRDALKKQVDERARLQRAKERLELEKDKIREQMEKEKQDVEKKLAEARKDKDKFEKLLKEEKEKAVPLPYLPMAPPPRPSSSAARHQEVPRTSSTEPRPHRSSIDSNTSQASTIHFDMLQLPNGERGSGLSVIHEDVSAGRASPSVNSASGSTTTTAPPPTWFTNPPIDYGKINGDSTPNGSYRRHPNQPDYLSPPDNNTQNFRKSTASSSTYEFIIEPPSRPPSVLGGGDPESNNSYNAHNTHRSNPEDPHFLSPNHRPIPLPQSQPQNRAESPAARPTLPRYGDTTSRIPTRPNTPAGFMGTVDVNGGFPPGFVPQSITDARGRSTPIIVGGGFIPPSPSGGGGLERSSTPAPIYGNPIARERDKKREAAASAATPPQSPRSHSPGGDWSAPLAALHPPIFPVTGPQQPFQHPPPGSWGGGSSTTTNDRLRNEHSPVLSTRPFIPGQTSTVSSGEGTKPNHHPGGFGSAVMTPGPRNQDFSSPVIPTQPLASGGAWGAPRRPLSGFGGGAGSTPGPRSQDLPPVIPNPTVGGGGWNTSSRPPTGFGGGGMTPRPRDQDLPPVIPNPSGWSSTPSRAPGGGMTPGPRSQDLPPVIPNSTMGGGWGTSSRPPVSFGGGGGTTPGPRNQDLPPVIPNPTAGGGWNTSSRPPSGFGGGGTPGPRSQDLPPVIPNPTVGGGWNTSSRPLSGFGGGTPGPRSQDMPPVIPNPTAGGGWNTSSRPLSGFGGGGTPGPRSQDLPPVIPNSTMGGGWTPSRPPVSFGGGGGMTPGPRNQDLPPVIPNPTVSGGWSTGNFGGGSTPGPKSQELPPVIPNSTMGGGWSSPNPPRDRLGSGGMTPGPRSQDLPPVIPNSTMGGGWTPSRAAGGFGAGSTPGPTNQDLPSVGGGGGGSPFQPSFSIYGPPTNGSRSSSPYPDGEGVGEDGDTDPITALNTKMNATLGTDVGPSAGAGRGGGGGKAGKRGKKKR